MIKSESYILALSEPEGPVQMPNGDFLVVEMGEQAGSVSYIKAATRKVRRIVRTGRPNGLARDRNNNIWVAESKEPALLKINLEGNVETVFDECDGKPFMFPNDLAFGPDGMLYMTDSGIFHQDFVINGSIRKDFVSAPYDGKVFCIDCTKPSIYTIDDGIKFTNGIAFGPDGLLYVNETITGNVYRYRMVNGRYDDDKIYFRGPDGMKFSASGKLFCAVYGQGNITVLNRNGSVSKRIKTLGRCPTNLVFGLPGSKSFFVTEVGNGCLERHSITEDGMMLYLGK